jgi:arabinogalactan endo-1,4-beta-galactosidase
MNMEKKGKNILLTAVVIAIFLHTGSASGQEFIFGHDLSYVNQMEDCGAVFRENMEEKDVFRIFADHGSNLVRARLWVDPSWWQGPLDQPDGVKSHYNDLEDVKETFRRAKSAGMKTMLGFHYSDFWADPGRQLIPRGWLDVAYNHDAMVDSVYSYTSRVLGELDDEELMPDFVKVGNETNPGILKHIPEENGWNPVESVSNSWERHARIFNAATSAVREVGAAASINPKIALHFAGALTSHKYSYNNIINNGVTDFDIIGISYYYHWHEGSIAQLEVTAKDLLNTYPAYEFMVVETGYQWTNENFDGMGNIITTADPRYLPVIPEKQLEYMTDYARAVMRAGGSGVIFWEPAWVSTPCRTPWGAGSAHDNLVFFDPVNNNFMDNGGGLWCEPGFYNEPDAAKISFELDMRGKDISAGVYIGGDFFGEGPEIRPMADEGGGIYSYYTYLSSGDTLEYYFLDDSSWAALEPVPAECRAGQDGLRRVVGTEGNQEVSFTWGSCEPAGPPPEVDVKFMVSMKGSGMDLSNGVYIVGEITNWEFIHMPALGDSLYSYTFKDVLPGTTTAYYFITNNSWNNYEAYRETVPEECAYSDEVTGDPTWTSDRGLIVPDTDTMVGYVFGTCTVLDPSTGIEPVSDIGTYFLLYPNPASEMLIVETGPSYPVTGISLTDLAGRSVLDEQYPGEPNHVCFDVSGIPEGLYLASVLTASGILTRRLIIYR